MSHIQIGHDTYMNESCTIRVGLSEETLIQSVSCEVCVCVCVWQPRYHVTHMNESGTICVGLSEETHIQSVSCEVASLATRTARNRCV